MQRGLGWTGTCGAAVMSNAEYGGYAHYCNFPNANLNYPNDVAVGPGAPELPSGPAPTTLADAQAQSVQAQAILAAQQQAQADARQAQQLKAQQDQLAQAQQQYASAPNAQTLFNLTSQQAAVTNLNNTLPPRLQAPTVTATVVPIPLVTVMATVNGQTVSKQVPAGDVNALGCTVDGYCTKAYYNAQVAKSSNATPGVTSSSGSSTPLTPQAGGNVVVSDGSADGSSSMMPLLLGAGVLAFFLIGGKK